MEFIKKNKVLLLLLALTSICLFFSTGHLTNIFTDVGREIDYPLEILKGKVLYKDLFCIYGPLSYLINAFIYKILGVKLTSLYFMGILSAFSIVTLTYIISKRFLSESLSFTITFFVIVTGCLSTRIFNFTLPYCYAVLYGLVSVLFSLFFVIRYKDTNLNKYLYLASFMGGLSVSLKYDFILYFIPLLYLIFKTKKIDVIIKNLILFLFAIIFPFIILFIQGLRFSDLLSSFNDIKLFTNTAALKNFYITQGVYYTKRIWSNWLEYVLFTAFFYIFIYFGVFFFEKKEKFKKIIGIVLILIGAHFVFKFLHVGSYLFLNFLTCVLFVLFFKKNTKLENFFIISSILICIKSFWGISHTNYGLYYISLIFISLFIILSQICSKRVLAGFNILLFIFALYYMSINISWIGGVNYKIYTNKGNLYTILEWGESTNKLLDFINDLNEDNPFIVIFPEGLNVNFLSKKETKTEGYYNSLIPLYVEGFGEDRITNYYKNNMPDYVVFSNFSGSDYGKTSICDDFAENFCTYIFDNYSPTLQISGKENDRYFILKKN